MVFDARFQPETRAILRHLWAHLAGSKLRLLFCMGGNDKRSSMGRKDHCIDGFQVVEQMEVTTGQNSFTMCAYQRTTVTSQVEVAVFSGGRIGIRALTAMSAGPPIMKVVGLRISTSRWNKLRTDIANSRWQWALKCDEGWFHVLNTARFVNGSWNALQINARYIVGDGNQGETQLVCRRDVSAGEEIMAGEDSREAS